MRATCKLWNQKSFDSEPFLVARMAASYSGPTNML
jgi:hypothetical protein